MEIGELIDALRGLKNMTGWEQVKEAERLVSVSAQVLRVVRARQMSDMTHLDGVAYARMAEELGRVRQTHQMFVAAYGPQTYVLLRRTEQGVTAERVAVPDHAGNQRMPDGRVMPGALDHLNTRNTRVVPAAWAVDLDDPDLDLDRLWNRLDRRRTALTDRADKTT